MQWLIDCMQRRLGRMQWPFELQVNTASHQLAFFDARSCKQLAASATRSLRWASASGPASRGLISSQLVH